MSSILILLSQLDVASITYVLPRTRTMETRISLPSLFLVLLGVSVSDGAFLLLNEIQTARYDD
ncbi:MAG: hypothetical protein J6U54_10300 [Clostridiales bacterium]|nr:hypothetical protein [Clostridiales bacterium]